jgi:PAS domain S-box-containing protein
MATILIVDDQPINRELLVTLLGYKGHRLVEAADGAEGLVTARTERPDLIITDILMPMMDGYEFVRQLRADPALTQIPIIFYTAYYLEREARLLAQACGVVHVLPNPSEPETILATVEAILGLTPSPERPPPVEMFDQEHLRLLTNKLAQQADELRATNRKLDALIEIGLELASERDPLRLLDSFCQAARKLIGVSSATVSLFREGEAELHLLLTHGLDSETAAQLGSSLPRSDILTTLLTERCPYRLHNPGGKPEAAGFPPSYPPIHCLLVVPILSPTRVYGWLSLMNKVGAEEFGDEEEWLAMILAALVGRVYENGQLYVEVQRQARELEQEVAERRQAQEALLRREQEFRSLAENALDIIVRFDRQLRHLYVNQRIEAKTGLPPSAFIGRTNRELGLPEQIVDYWDEKLRQVFASGQADTIEFEFPTPGGSGYFEAQLIPETTPTGSVETVLVISRDIMARKQAEQALLRSIQEMEIAYQQSVIYARELRTEITERRQAQAALAESQRRLQALFDHTQDAILLMDDEARYVDANPAACALLGYSHEELLQLTILDVTPAPDRERALQTWQAFITGGQGRGEFTILRQDATTREVEFRAVANIIPGLHLSVLRDVTERKQMQEALQRRVEELAALQATVLDMTASHDLPTLLQTIVERAAQLLKAPSGGLFLCDSEQQEVRCVVSYRTARDYTGLILKYGEGAAGTVAQTGEPLLIKDYQTWPGRAAAFGEGTFPVILSVPMFWQSRVTGVIQVYDSESRQFIASDLELLGLFANHAAIAVENARLLEGMQRRAEEAETLRQAGAVVVATLQQEEAIQRILEQLARVVPYGSASVQLLRQGYLEIVGGRGWSEPGSAIGVRLPVPGDNPNTMVIQQRRPYLLGHVRAAFPTFGEESHTPIQSWLGVPLIAHDQVIGMLTLDSDEPDYFTPDHLRLAAAFADQVAIALENVRLFAEARDAQERLHTLSRRLVELQETERRHIARELHDEIGQVLTGLKLLLGMSARLPTEQASVNLAEAQTLLNELMDKVDELSLNLRPPMLDDLGLLPTLLWHLERFTQQTNIQVTFQHVGLEGRRFTPEVETAAYRLVQEALTNVARHAGVSEVKVQLWTNPETLLLQVEDQGSGFDSQIALAAGASSGLSGMRERAMLLGGQLMIESAPGAGASLMVELPLRSPGKGEDEYDHDPAGG